MKRNIALALGIVALLIAVPLIGCGGKVAQCNKLIEVINGQQQVITDATGKLATAATDPKALGELAAALEKAAGEIEKVELADEKLKAHQGEFAGVFKGAAKTMHEMAKAKDPAAMSAKLGDLTKAMGGLAEITTKINGYCQQ